jgi:hypothetical protein
VEAAGFRGKVGDCVTRSIAIATRLPYRHVYAVEREARRERPTRGRDSSARNRVFRQICQRVLESLGWGWVPTMCDSSQIDRLELATNLMLHPERWLYATLPAPVPLVK